MIGISGSVRRWMAVAVCAAVVAGAGACARPVRTPVEIGDARDQPALGVGGGGGCELTIGTPSPTPAVSRQPLPRDFDVTTVRRCVVGIVAVPGDGEWTVRNYQEATDGLDSLLSALRAPSSPLGTENACPAIAVVPIELTLVDAAGKTVEPSVPTDSCGLPSPAVMRALEALSWKTVKQEKVGRSRSQIEVESGCPGRYKPVVALMASDGDGRTPPTPPARGPLFDGTPPSALTVCRYKLDTSETIMLSNAKPIAIGALESAGKLTGENLARFLAALGGAPPVTAVCKQTQSPFVVLMPEDGRGGWITVELDGCFRAADTESRLRQLDAATVALLRS
jgi:hypothetical protein